MCLQDYQLARSCMRRTYNLTFVGGVAQQVLTYDDSRVGVLILGPSAGVLDLRWGSNSSQAIVDVLSTGDPIETRYFSLFNMGTWVCEPLWINPNANGLGIVIEYTLPVDPENLQRLAAKGKW